MTDQWIISHPVTGAEAMIVHEEGARSVWRWQRPDNPEVNVFIGPADDVDAALDHICGELDK